MRQTVHGRPAAPILGALLLAALSYALAQTVVAPALPAITQEFGTTSSSASWLLTGYLLSASVFTPLAGKLGDLFGKARVMTVLLLAFAVGSTLAALATSIELVIAGRIVMGSAGGVFPLAFGIINDEFPAEQRAVAIGMMSAMFGIGGGVGLPLSGVIVDNADISWLFWIGLLALPAAVGVWRLVPPSPPRERTRVDWAGAAVLSIGLAALLLGISKANAWGWGSARVLGLMLGGLVVLVAFVALERRTRDPLVDIRVFAERPVLATNVTGFLTGMAMFGSFLMVPMFLQAPEQTGYGFGMSVTDAGLLMIPSAVVMLFAGPLGGMLGNRVGFRRVLSAGTAFIALSFVVLALAHDDPWQFAAANMLVGLGISFGFASMANLIVALVRPTEVGIATGINTITRTVGGAFGSAAVTALLTAETIPGTPLPTEGAFVEAFLASTAVALCALVASFAIPRRRDSEEADAPRPDEAADGEPALASQR